MSVGADVPSRVHPVVPGDRTVDDQDVAAEEGRGEQPVHVELIRAGPFEGSQDDRQVFRPAARQDRVHGDLLDRAFPQVGRDQRDHLPWVAGRALEHSEHALGGR